jgi:hypothetical protein
MWYCVCEKEKESEEERRMMGEWEVGWWPKKQNMPTASKPKSKREREREVFGV